jgi:hypothetical protein
MFDKGHQDYLGGESWGLVLKPTWKAPFWEQFCIKLSKYITIRTLNSNFFSRTLAPDGRLRVFGSCFRPFSHFGLLIENNPNDKTENAQSHQLTDMGEEIAGHHEIDTHQDDAENRKGHGETLAGNELFHALKPFSCKEDPAGGPAGQLHETREVFPGKS